MIAEILQLLKLTEIGKSDLIDVAKGKNKVPKNLKEFKNLIKWQLQKR